MRLREIRENNGFTQFTISKLMGVSRGTYAVWEVGIDLIPIKRLNDFCNICNVSIDYALNFTETPQYIKVYKRINPQKSGERLKEIRKENRKTQEYISKKLNINRSLLSKYEKGHTLISTTFLIEYIKLFSISGDYLLGKINDKITLKELVTN